MLRRHALFTPLLAAAAWARGTQAAPFTDADAAFQRVAARYFADLMDLDPLNASAIAGWPQYEGRMEITVAPAAIANAKVLYQRVARELLATRIDELNPAHRVSHELLAWEVNRAIDGLKFPTHLMPIDQFGGVPMLLANMAAGDQAQPLKTPADYANYFKRLKRLPEFNRQAVANMRQGMQQGYTVPRALIDTALPAFNSLAEPVFEKSPFAQALKVMPATFVRETRERITAELYQIVHAARAACDAGLGRVSAGPVSRGLPHQRGPVRRARRRRLVRAPGAPAHHQRTHAHADPLPRAERSGPHPRRDRARAKALWLRRQRDAVSAMARQRAALPAARQLGAGGQGLRGTQRAHRAAAAALLRPRTEARARDCA